MFSVKAVRASGEYTISPAHHVDIFPAGAEPNSGPGTDILLFDSADSAPREMLAISNDPDEFVTAYIMNDRGKTIDTVSAPEIAGKEGRLP
jgi:hypothetical protein